MNPQPKKKYEYLIDEINEILLSGRRNDIAVARVKREAESLRGTDLVGALVVLGAIAGYQGDVEAMHQHHRKALEWSGESAMALHNYANSMNTAGLFSGSLAYATRAYAISNNPLSLHLMILASFHLGLNSMCRKHMEEWERVTGKRHEIADEITDERRGVLRPEILEMLNADMEQHDELWANLAKV